MNNHFNKIIFSVQNSLHEFVETVEYLILCLELEIPSSTESQHFRIVAQNEILDEIASMEVNCIAKYKSNY